MKAAGIEADVITYTALMQACNKCKQWQQAVAVYGELEHNDSVQPDGPAYAEAVRAYKELGDTDKVAELKTKMTV
jgi:pentatricopeptide repeat protein